MMAGSNTLYCINFTRWKQNYVRVFLELEGEVLFVSSAKDATKKGFCSTSKLVTWASKNQSEVDKLTKQFGVKAWSVEDGFIRSTGLGSDLTAPASLVVDKTGVYYDPSAPSDLENILQTKMFSEAELKRSKALIGSILESELSKYNLGGNTFRKSSLKLKPNQKIILIPGQVEDDASIKKGCIDIDTNSKLIKEVKKKQPDAYLIYKPHPDVVSGNRKGKVEKNIIGKYIDLELTDVSITDCLAVVDEVHTMTSLVGFEGLMRRLWVVCYGLPFYSNWGLTEDRHALARRCRKLNLTEMAAGVLIDYPHYIDWESNGFTEPEEIVGRLKEQIDREGGKKSNEVLWFVRAIRKGSNFFSGIKKKV